MGIGPTRPAWKAGILPLNYTRISLRLIILTKFTKSVNRFKGIPYIFLKFFMESVPQSFAAVIKENHKSALYDNFKIQPDTLLPNIFNVEFNPFVKLNVVAVFLNLP